MASDNLATEPFNQVTQVSAVDQNKQVAEESANIHPNEVTQKSAVDLNNEMGSKDLAWVRSKIQ